MWRPEGWKTIPLWSRLYDGKPITSTHEAFEAGADAMLTALLESNEPGCEIFKGEMLNWKGEKVPIVAYGKSFKGKWVFIPCEE